MCFRVSTVFVTPGVVVKGDPGVVRNLVRFILYCQVGKLVNTSWRILGL